MRWASAAATANKIGTLFSLMVNKRSGQAVYAVLTIGGFLGMGRAYYPLPFSLLQFDAVADTYVVTIDRRVLEGGPSWGGERAGIRPGVCGPGCRNITTWRGRI